MTVSLSAEHIGSLGGFPITNAMINSVIAMILFLAVAYGIRWQIQRGSGKLTGGAEMLVEKLIDIGDQVTGERNKTLRFLPFFGSVFLFILVSNWLGLIPGTGSIGLWKMEEGVREFIPLLRPATSDLNTTLALAVITLVVSHIIGIRSHGIWNYINRFIRFQDLWSGIRKGGMGIFTGFVNFFIGFIEIIGEMSRVLSLSLRLFGNILAGEILLGVIGSLIAFAAPLPFMALEIIVGIVQAIIFAVLALVYITIATTEHEQSDH